MTRWGLAVAASLATACGIGVVGVIPLDTDAGTAVAADAGMSSDARVVIPDAGAETSSPVDAAAEVQLPTNWCATQPTHQLCFDFDDGTLGSARIEASGSATCAVSGGALGCKTSGQGSTAVAVMKEWKPRPKAIDLSFDVTISTGGYAQLGGLTTTSPYYELLVTPSGGNLDFIQFSEDVAVAKTLTTQGTGLHHMRVEVDFTTNRLIVSEGGAVKYDVTLAASLTGISAVRAIVGIYDSDDSDSVILDNVTIDWTE